MDPITLPCQACGGAGCTDCGGRRLVTPALAALQSANAWLTHFYPHWDERDAGVTDWSLARWYRHRTSYQLPITDMARGRPGRPAEVEILARTTPSLVKMTLRGLSWGYTGSGPLGLAVVLTDAGFFPESGLEEAYRFVREALTEGDAWVLMVNNGRWR